MALQQCGTCKTELTAGRLRIPGGIHYTNGNGLRIALIIPGEEFCRMSCIVRKLDEKLAANAVLIGRGILAGHDATEKDREAAGQKPRFACGDLNMEVSHEDS
jgi:hypothetical protein